MDLERDGFAVLVQGAAGRALERLDGELAEAAAAGAEDLVLRGDDGVLVPARPGATIEGAVVVDPHAALPAARELLLMGGTVTEAMATLLGAPPLLFASRLGEVAGPLAPDRHTVVVSDPAALVGVRVALEDGAVTVVPGSHMIEPYRFSGRYPHLNVERDGEDAAEAARAHLETAGLGHRRVELARGDALVWTGALAIGEQRGRALVGWACPLDVAEPGFFAHREDRRTVVRLGAGAYAAELHELEAPPPDPPAEEIVREMASGPSDPAGRRRRGLVGRVRGMLDRD